MTTNKEKTLSDPNSNEAKSYFVIFKDLRHEGGTPTGFHKSVRLIADYFTVEPSGALTFWIRSEDRERSALIAAYGRDEWKAVTLAS